MSETIMKLTKENFQKNVESTSKPLLVDFWAPWCGPCRMIAPELEAVAEELKDKARIAKVNVDEEPEIAEKYGVQGIPNLIVFKNGKPINQLVGFQNRKTLVEALTSGILWKN